jgi:hypothetical protein
MDPGSRVELPPRGECSRPLDCMLLLLHPRPPRPRSRLRGALQGAALSAQFIRAMPIPGKQATGLEEVVDTRAEWTWSSRSVYYMLLLSSLAALCRAPLAHCPSKLRRFPCSPFLAGLAVLYRRSRGNGAMVRCEGGWLERDEQGKASSMLAKRTTEDACICATSILMPIPPIYFSLTYPDIFTSYLFSILA